ncbi:MAG: hypothetical protein D6727_05915, partial [Gammaproteobacteria bacterium]
MLAILLAALANAAAASHQVYHVDVVGDLEPLGNSVYFRGWVDTTFSPIRVLRRLAPGDTAPTTLVADDGGQTPANCEPETDFAANLETLGNFLYFACTRSFRGSGLWRTDGTPAGTVLLGDFSTHGFSTPRGLFRFAGRLFFTADGSNGRELWKTDGTAAGTVLVKDIRPGTASTTFFSFPAALPNFIGVPTIGKLFFVADDGVAGSELWVTDGTEAGTFLLKDINPGPAPGVEFRSTTPGRGANLAEMEGEVFFIADDGTHGSELWVTDGTVAGTKMLKDVMPGAASSNLRDLVVVRDDLGPTVTGTLFFLANGPSGFGLWKSDGTEAGTVLLKQFAAARELSAVQRKLFFTADDGGGAGAELWKSDGTAAGTVLVANIAAEPFQSSPGRALGYVNGKAYFRADDQIHGAEPWVSDGTAAGTALLEDLEPGPGTSLPDVEDGVIVDGTLFFEASLGGSGLNKGRDLVALPISQPPPTNAKSDSTANVRHAGRDRDPVNTFNGELYTNRLRDIDLGGPMPLYFERYYASYLRRSFIVGDLGSNWRHNFDARLFWVGNVATYVSAIGRVTQFLNIGGNWVQQDNLDTPYQLHTAAGQDAVLYDPVDERIYTFDFTTGNIVNGRLRRVEDGHGNVHSLSYDPATGQLLSVSDGLGRTLSFSYNAAAIPKISSVSDGTRAIVYEYTDPIDPEALTIVRDTRNFVTTYSYKDTSGTADHALLISMTRPNGNVPFVQTFFAVPDPNSGKVATQTDAAGNTYSFAYAAGQTTITDPAGNSRVHQHGAAGELTTAQDAAGEIASRSFDGNGQPASFTDRLGATTTLAVDGATGLLTGFTAPDGGSHTFGYSSRVFANVTLNDLTAITHPDGSTETFTRDANGNPVTYTDQAGFTSTATFDAHGQPLTITNPLGGVVSYTYNADGTPAAVQDPAGNVTSYGYDAFRRLNRVTQPDGSTAALVYDDADNLLQLVDENGHITAMSYDA